LGSINNLCKDTLLGTKISQIWGKKNHLQKCPGMGYPQKIVIILAPNGSGKWPYLKGNNPIGGPIFDFHDLWEDVYNPTNDP